MNFVSFVTYKHYFIPIYNGIWSVTLLLVVVAAFKLWNHTKQILVNTTMAISNDVSFSSAILLLPWNGGSQTAIVRWHAIDSESGHTSASDRAPESVSRIRFVFSSAANWRLVLFVVSESGHENRIALAFIAPLCNCVMGCLVLTKSLTFATCAIICFHRCAG